MFERPEESFAREFFTAMRPELVAPVVAYLVHQWCTLDGEVLVAGAGQVRRLVVGETAGIVVPELTPEDVGEQLDAILDTTVTEPTPVGFTARLGGRQMTTLPNDPWRRRKTILSKRPLPTFDAGGRPVNSTRRGRETPMCPFPRRPGDRPGRVPPRARSC